VYESAQKAPHEVDGPQEAVVVPAPTSTIRSIGCSRRTYCPCSSQIPAIAGGSQRTRAPAMRRLAANRQSEEKDDHLK
jgi:hypothetical protein